MTPALYVACGAIYGWAMVAMVSRYFMRRAYQAGVRVGLNRAMTVLQLEKELARLATPPRKP